MEKEYESTIIDVNPKEHEVAIRPQGEMARITKADVSQLKEQIGLIHEIYKSVMQDGVHYGIIPGCEKPSLYQAGAQKLAFVFRMVPRYHIAQSDLGNGHREYRVRCELFSLRTGDFIGEGLGSCSTMESKYRFRTGPTEVTKNPVPKQYWTVRKDDPKAAQAMLGGPGHTVKKVDKSWFIAVKGERIENDNIADQYNTVLKIGKKRSYVDAVLANTACSDVFTQDMEDLAGNGNGPSASEDDVPDTIMQKDMSESTPPPEPPPPPPPPSQENGRSKRGSRDETNPIRRKANALCDHLQSRMILMGVKDSVIPLKARELLKLDREINDLTDLQLYELEKLKDLIEAM